MAATTYRTITVTNRPSTRSIRTWLGDRMHVLSAMVTAVSSRQAGPVTDTSAAVPETQVDAIDQYMRSGGYFRM